MSPANLKPILKLVPAIFQHADKVVRVEGSNLVVEISRWIGPAVNACFEGLKAVQVKELQELLAKVPPEKPQPLRRRRAEQKDTSLEVDGLAMACEDAPMRLGFPPCFLPSPLRSQQWLHG